MISNVSYIIIVLSIVLIVLLNIFTSRKITKNDTVNINKLIRQTSRWATAAQQDTNAYIANLHATYALGYLMALREIYSDEIIMHLTRVDVRKLEGEVTNIMDEAVEKLIKVCPSGQPKNKYLAYLSKEGGFS